jgi:hypothetical protein
MTTTATATPRASSSAADEDAAPMSGLDQIDARRHLTRAVFDLAGDLLDGAAIETSPLETAITHLRHDIRHHKDAIGQLAHAAIAERIDRLKGAVDDIAVTFTYR